MTLTLHPTYLDAGVRAQIAAAYRANALPSVQLQGFLDPKQYAAILAELKKAAWREETIPDRYSRETAKLTRLLALTFGGKDFAALVKQITGKTLKGKPRLQAYSHRQFTLRNDEEKPPGLLVYFDMTPNWLAQWGGATVISNEQGELARVPPLPNTLVLIDCSASWPFVQYVNHYASDAAIVRVVWE